MVDLGSAELVLQADVSGFDNDIDHAKAKVQGLGKEVQSLPGVPPATTKSMEELSHATEMTSEEFQAFSRAEAEAKAAADDLAESNKRGANTLKTFAKGAALAAAAILAFKGAQKVFGALEEQSPAVKAQMTALNVEWTEMKANLIEGVTPAAVGFLIALQGGLSTLGAFAEGVGNVHEALKNLGSDFEDFLNFAGLGGSSLEAATGHRRAQTQDQFDEAVKSVETLNREESRRLFLFRQQNAELFHQGAESKKAVRYAEELLRLEQATRGPGGERGRGGGEGFVVPAPIMPAEWIGTVKGQFASLAEYIEGVMREALYPTEAVLTQAEQDVERAKLTLTQLEARRRDEGGLGAFDEGVWTAQIEKLTGLIGPGAAQEFVTGLVNNAGLITGVLGDAAYVSGMEMLKGAQRAFESANFARVIADEANLGDAEQFKRGMEQVGSAEPLYPGVLEDITNVGILDGALTELPIPYIQPTINIGPAMAAIATLRYALLSISNITPAGPGGERGGATAGITPPGFNPASLTMLPAGGATPRTAVSLAGATRSVERRIGGRLGQRPTVVNNIVGVLPEDVERQTHRALRRVALEFGGAG